MQISWNGLGSFTIVAKPAQSEVTVVTNPFVSTEVKFKSTQASIVVQSHEGKDTNNLSAVSSEHPDDNKDVFVVSHAGEYEVQGVFVTGIEASKKDGTPHAIYRFDAENIKIGFLGAIDRTLTAAEVEALGPIDILIVPADKTLLSSVQAAEVVGQVEPRIVIPSYCDAAAAGALQREIGCQMETTSKFKITRAGLPEEDMKMVTFEK